MLTPAKLELCLHTRRPAPRGDFQESTYGAPDHWSSSGSTSNDVNSASAGGSAVVQQLSALGAVLASTPLASTLTQLAGVTQVRILLNGGLVGATTFDNVWMGEN